MDRLVADVSSILSDESQRRFFYWRKSIKIFLKIGQAGKKAISKNILDFLCKINPLNSTLIPTTYTLPPIYIF